MLDPRLRTALAFLHDVVATAFAWVLAFLVRFNFEIPEFYGELMLDTLLWVAPVQGSGPVAFRALSGHLALCKRARFEANSSSPSPSRCLQSWRPS